MERIERQRLINAIALRLGTAKELATKFDIPVSELRQFVDDNRPAIEAAQRRLEGGEEPKPESVTPTQLDQLWISNKFDRLLHLQAIADATYKGINDGEFMGAELAMAVREFRSYLMLAANELGQLLHRGSGETGTGDSLSIDIQGVDMETVR